MLFSRNPMSTNDTLKDILKFNKDAKQFLNNEGGWVVFNFGKKSRNSARDC